VAFDAAALKNDCQRAIRHRSAAMLFPAGTIGLGLAVMIVTMRRRRTDAPDLPAQPAHGSPQ
jgi:hypothetical protein